MKNQHYLEASTKNLAWLHAKPIPPVPLHQLPLSLSRQTVVSISKQVFFCYKLLKNISFYQKCICLAFSPISHMLPHAPDTAFLKSKLSFENSSSYLPPLASLPPPEAYLLLSTWHAYTIHWIASCGFLPWGMPSMNCTVQPVCARKLRLLPSGFENKVQQWAIKPTSCGLLHIHAWDSSHPLPFYFFTTLTPAAPASQPSGTLMEQWAAAAEPGAVMPTQAGQRAAATTQDAENELQTALC